MFDLIDRIVSLDLGQRGMAALYRAARQRAEQPLCLAAARVLSEARAGDHVVFLTGSIVRGWLSPSIAETDGPVGVAALARALNVERKVVPVIFTDPPLVAAVAATVEAAGMTVVDAAHALAAARNERASAFAVVRSGCEDRASAADEAREFLAQTQPKAIVAVERAGMTRDGTFRNSVGQDTSAGRGYLDFLVSEGAKLGIPTIGIGDLGNEIGMGAIADAVAEHIPNGANVCAALGTDVVFPCGVSNWGCYAIQAALAMLCGRAELSHTAAMERHLLEQAARIGLVDGLTGRREASADGLPLAVHLAVVDLLETTARRGIRFQEKIGDDGPVHEIERLKHYRKLMT